MGGAVGVRHGTHRFGFNDPVRKPASGPEWGDQQTYRPTIYQYLFQDSEGESPVSRFGYRTPTLSLRTSLCVGGKDVPIVVDLKVVVVHDSGVTLSRRGTEPYGSSVT